MLQKQNNSFSNNIMPFAKHKTPIKGGSVVITDNKTPVSHFCTPKHFRPHTFTGSTKMNILPATRTPIKCYFMDNASLQATPECFSNVQLETPCVKSTEIGVEDQTVCEGEKSNLTVGIRIRPLNSKETDDPKITSVVSVNGQNIIVEGESIHHTFTYDHCFSSYLDPTHSDYASQESIFKTMVLPLVHDAFEGYNVCLLAYGQTGSGKSYSMMGQDLSQTGVMSLDEGSGVIPRFCQEIFARVSKNVETTTTVEISYFEIYNEKIHDLLAAVTSGSKRAPLKVREHPIFGPYIVDLSQHCVQNYKDLQTWLKVGNSQRATAATGMNEKSSRSHCIFSIVITQTKSEGQQKSNILDASRRSKINLVDLAGSERLSQTCASGDRLKEGVSINKSLLTLGKVIASLAENTSNRRRGFVPYRESVLTWLLKESLGGNSRTAMLGTVSPANIHVEETLATLRYACQARAIINRVRINEDPHERLIRELKAEVLRLRGVREGYEKQLGVFPRRLLDSIEPTPQTKDEIMQKQTEIDKLKDQLRKTEEQLVATQMTRLERLQKTEEKKNSELKYLRRCGIAIEIDFHEKDRQPCLVNLTADPMLSGTLLYLIPPGSVRIGKNCASRIPSRDPDIILDGPLVRQLHCTIENNNGKLILAPEMDGDTYVNGQVVTGKVFLKHGDRLVIGGNHYFKVSNPHDRHRGDIQISTQAVDFEYAHQEILRVQEEKLRTELEESKQKAIKELENAKHEIELQLGTQKISYERKIEILGSTLEEQKHALEKINQQKRKLELEKELLANEVETNNRRKQMQVQEDNVNITPYKSNFLQELENILSEKTADVEIALKMKASRDVMNAGGISLHELQLLVKEATERCREFAINYEFDQQQIVVEKSLQSVVRIRDRDRMMETLWEPLYFLDWLRRLRDYDIEDSIKELREWGGDWEPYENSEVFEDSLNTSRISINMTPVKRHLNESLHQLSMDMSTFGEMTADYTLDISKQREDMNVCLIQMETAAKALRKLCERYESPGLDAITKYLNKVHNIIGNLKDTLDLNDIMQGESVCSVQSIDNTVIEKSDDASRASSVICNDKMSVVPKSDCSPTKSSFRNNNPQSTKNGGTPKIVRFTEKKEGDLT